TPVDTAASPEVRRVKWWWRIHSAATDLDMRDVFWLAHRFVERELANELLGEKLEFDDLEAFLAYRPWKGPEKEMAYLVAIDDKRINAVTVPRLEQRYQGNFELQYQLGVLATHEVTVWFPEVDLHEWEEFEKFMASPEGQGMLPSQLVAEWQGDKGGVG
ncbi:MAG: hypothetical protein QGI09_10120, partial [Dehalococcoidia bacterium]|nr:hypothetical protein [Dehalococcoidia bacterium]